MVGEDEMMEDGGIGVVEVIEKDIGEGDLMGMVERMRRVLVRGLSNEREVERVFNYVVEWGDRWGLRGFIEEIGEG